MLIYPHHCRWPESGRSLLPPPVWLRDPVRSRRGQQNGCEAPFSSQGSIESHLTPGPRPLPFLSLFICFFIPSTKIY